MSILCFYRNLSVIENIISVMMAMLVGGLGALILSRNIYYDFCIFVFCFIIAGCQYSLLKSVQPDAASPMHVSIPRSRCVRYLLYLKPLCDVCLSSSTVFLTSPRKMFFAWHLFE